MECEYYYRCMNKSKCYRCINKSLLKLKENKIYKRKKNSNANLNADNSWEDLESQVANKLNNIPSIEQARRTIGSGAFFEKGDVKDIFLHPECKERKGILNTKGEKSISIKKLWLEKAKRECENNSDKYMCLPFRFKGDTNIYTIIDFDDLANIITLLKSFYQDNQILKKENETIKKILNDKKGKIDD